MLHVHVYCTLLFPLVAPDVPFDEQPVSLVFGFLLSLSFPSSSSLSSSPYNDKWILCVRIGLTVDAMAEDTSSFSSTLDRFCGLYKKKYTKYIHVCVHIKSRALCISYKTSIIIKNIISLYTQTLYTT